MLVDDFTADPIRTGGVFVKQIEKAHCCDKEKYSKKRKQNNKIKTTVKAIVKKYNCFFDCFAYNIFNKNEMDSIMQPDFWQIKIIFRGIDTIKFGENISIIQKRSTFKNISVLEVYDKAIDVFRDYYQYEVIRGADRQKIEKIPEAAFREAIANALIYRVWDVDSQIRVSMFDDRLEIVSPGGLSSGITEEEYLSGKLSILRNRNLANVFYRLGFVEIFGTGITRIKQLYADGLIKPDFEISENAIKIVLPIFEKNADLTE